MSLSVPVSRRLAVVAATAAGAMLFTALPAYADTDISVEGAPRTLSAGGESGSFTTIVENDNDSEYRAVRLIVVVRLSDLRGSQVRVSRNGEDLPVTPGNGTVRFADPNTFPLDRGDDATRTYELRFLDSAPDGRASLTVEAYGQGERGGLRLIARTRSQSITVEEGDPSATPGASPTPGKPLDNIPTAQPSEGAAVPPATNAAKPASSNGLLWPIYLIGLLLLLLGAGAVGYLFYARSREPEYEQPPAYGPPGYGHPMSDSPTMMLPRVSAPLDQTRVDPQPRHRAQ